MIERVLHFGARYNYYKIKKYLNLTDEQATKIIEKKFHGTSNENTFYDGWYDCIGHFWIKKKDIIFKTDSMGEDEVIVNPKDVILHEYRFLNAFDNVSLSYYQQFMNMVCFKFLGDKVSGVHSNVVLNNEEVLDWVYIVMKKHLIKYPDTIKRDIEDDRIEKEDIHKFMVSMSNYSKEVFGSPYTSFECVPAEVDSLNTTLYELTMVGKDWSYHFPRDGEVSIRQKMRLTKNQLNDKATLINTTQLPFDKLRQFKKDNPKLTSKELSERITDKYPNILNEVGQIIDSKPKVKKVLGLNKYQDELQGFNF